MSNDKEQQAAEMLRQLLLAAAAKQGGGLPGMIPGVGAADAKPKRPKGFVPTIKYYGTLFIKIFHKILVAGVVGVDRFANFVAKPTDSNRNEVAQFARSPILFGVYIIIIFFVGGGLWASLAPLDSAAYAIGTVIVDSKRQFIQHPRGGVVKSILVKQGDHVKAGDTVATLDDRDFRGDFEVALNAYRNSLATENRLIAERDNMDTIQFDDFLTKDAATIPEVAKLMTVQQNIFKTRIEVNRVYVQTNLKKIDQINQTIKSLEAKKVNFQQALRTVTERLNATRELVSKGFSNKAAQADLENKRSSIQSDLITIDTDISKQRQAISIAENDLAEYQGKRLSDILKELKDNQSNMHAAKEKYELNKIYLERAVLKSPVDGVVNALNITTIGAVISSGTVVAEITPSKDKLTVEAKIPTRNIDSVHVGLKAKLKFSAFKSRTSPSFYGTVVSLSPDTVKDPEAYNLMAQSNRNMAGDGYYYVAKIELDADYFDKVATKRDLKLVPGMTAEIQIVTGTRTLLGYLFDPIRDQAFKAFVER